MAPQVGQTEADHQQVASGQSDDGAVHAEAHVPHEHEHADDVDRRAQRQKRGEAAETAKRHKLMFDGHRKGRQRNQAES